jgi:peptidoglycan/LPS O-acetylase OafA/YrhL
MEDYISVTQSSLGGDTRGGTEQHDAPVSHKSPYIPALDGLRGIAILLVLAYHFMGYNTKRGWVLQSFFAFNRSGWIGVDLFFVLSGFLITRILLDVLGSRHYFRDFYVRRTLRIFPLYYLTLLVIFTAAHFVPALQSDATEAVAHQQAWLWLYGTNIFDAWHNHLTFAGGWIELNHLWSLAVEEQFYLFWAPVIFLCGIRKLPLMCLMMIVGALVLRIALWLGGQSDLMAYMLTPCRMDTLALGALLATLHRIRPLSDLTRPAVLIASIGTALLIGWGIKRNGLNHSDPVIWTVGFTVIALVCVSVLHLVVVAGDGSRVSKLLRTPVLASIGKYSYAIYLFHWSLAPGMFAHLLPEAWMFSHMRYVPALLLRFVLVTAMTYALAVVSWNLFEKHFLKLKRFFDYDEPARAGARTAWDAGAVELVQPNLVGRR